MIRNPVSEELQREMFRADVPYGEGLSPRVLLYHRSVLKQIHESPEMFEVWAEDSMMKYIYYDLVEPALRRKRNQKLLKSHL